MSAETYTYYPIMQQILSRTSRDITDKGEIT